MEDNILKVEDGILLKAVNVEGQEVTEADLKKINKFTLSPVSADEIFTFKAVLGDNETDDRNFEPFNLSALKDLQKLYIGKTVIKDHRRSADNQVARIYDTELQTETRTTKAGELYTKLIGYVYMVRTESNKDLIAEIKAGIKREVSTGCRPKKVVCSICGTDNAKTWCSHYAGQQYDKNGHKETCLMTIDGAKEAYELSFVAVPAQPRAGTIKNYGVKPPQTETVEEKQDESTKVDESIEKDLMNRIDLARSFIFEENERSHD